MLILANSNIFLIHPDTVELTIALKIFLKFNESCIFPSRLLSVISKYLLRVSTTYSSSSALELCTAEIRALHIIHFYM